MVGQPSIILYMKREVEFWLIKRERKNITKSFYTAFILPLEKMGIASFCSHGTKIKQYRRIWNETKHYSILQASKRIRHQFQQDKG